MSFTSRIKNELVTLDLSKLETVSELSGLLRNSIFENKSLVVATENAALAKFIFNNLKTNYNALIKVSVKKGYNYNKNYIYGLDIYKNSDVIVKDMSLDKQIPDRYLIDDEDTKRAYISGVFLACGSINDPKTSQYHMEFSFDNEEYAMFFSDMLNSYNLNSRILKRDSRFIVYVKESEKIADFLRIIKATNALLYYENIRIYKSRNNKINRINNCEQANVDKTIQSAANEIKDINYIKECDAYDLLDEKLKEACFYRLKYPEESLTELSRIISLETGVSITKSGLHHRFNKIKLLAERLKNKEK